MPRFPSSFCIALVSSARGDSTSVGAWSWSMSFMVSLLFSGMVSLFWNCGSLSNILSTYLIMRRLLHLVTHAWVGRTPSLSASSVFRVLFNFYKFCLCDDLAHNSMAVYRFFRASCCKWIGHHIWRLYLVIYVAQWERLTILCVSRTSSSPSSSPALSSNPGRLKAFIMLLALSVTTLTMCLCNFRCCKTPSYL